MQNARKVFITRVRAIASSLKEPVFIDKAPVEVEHNERALLLRNGIAVLSFANLELFIRMRTAEVLSSIAKTGMAFTKMPERLREACTYGALKGLLYQAELRKRAKEDFTLLIQEHSQKIASSSNPTFWVSDLTFGWDRSNLSRDDIKDILGCFQIRNCWEQMRQFAVRAGISVLSLEEAFRNAATRRHKAAHHSNAQVLLTELEGFVSEAIGIALSYDALLSRAARLILDQDASFLSGAKLLEQNVMEIRFLLEETPNRFREFEENSSRARHRYRGHSEALHGAEGNARPRRQVVVVKDRRNIPQDWIITDI